MILAKKLLSCNTEEASALLLLLLDAQERQSTMKEELSLLNDTEPGSPSQHLHPLRPSHIPTNLPYAQPFKHLSFTQAIGQIKLNQGE
jgi:hypothetical protein